MPEKALVTDYIFSDTSIERNIIESAGIEFEAIDTDSPDDIIESADGVTGLINQYTPLPKEVFTRLPALKVVGRYGIGVDDINLDAATANDVLVVNVPDYCIDEVSTHAISLLLACHRRLMLYDNHVSSGGWDWAIGTPIHRFDEKTGGIIGFGKIGRRTAEKLSGFGVDILVADPYVSDSEMQAYDVEKVSLETLLTQSDFVTVHVPLTDETRCLLDREKLSLLPEGSILVNTSRGGVISEEAIEWAVTEGPIDSAGLDVLESEPPDSSPLLDLENILLTPHVAWYSETSIEQLRRTTAEEVARVLTGDDPRHPVNPEVMTDG